MASDHISTRDSLQKLVATQEELIGMLRARVEQQERQLARLRDRRAEVDTEEPPSRKKPAAAPSPPAQKAPPKPRRCSHCHEEIKGFQCLKLECKEAKAKKKEAMKNAD